MNSPINLAEQFDDLEQQRHADTMGMWLFLATELLLFGGLFAAFYINRLLHTDVFAHAATHLDLVLGGINTAILLTSGLSMALAEQAVNEKRRAAVLAMLATTLALGVVFLGIKFYEWYIEYTEHLMPVLGLHFQFPEGDTGHARIYFSFYYAMTGLHAAHMALGLGVISVMMVFAWRWRQPEKFARQLQITGMYWAFVDIVWVFVFTSLYLLRA